MAKPRTPKDNQAKEIQETIRKRLTGLFSGTEEPPTYLSIRQVDELKAHVAELEAELAQRKPLEEPRIPETTLEYDSGTAPSGQAATRTAVIGEKQNSNAFRVALIGLPASILAASVYLFLAIQSGAWQVYAWSIDIWFLALFVAISLFLIRRKRTVLGIWLMIGAILVTFITAVALIQGLGLLLGISIAILVSIIAGQTLSSRSTNLAVGLGVAGGVAAILLDYFGPAYRLPEPAPVRIFLPAILIAVILLFGIVTIRQFASYSLRTKLILAFVAIAVAAVGSVSFIVDRSLRTTRTNEIGNNMETLARAEALQVGQILQNEFNLLNGLALTQSVQERAEAGTQADMLSQAEIDQLDKQWRAADSANNSADPLVATVLYDPLSYELLKFQAKFPENAEIFLTDLPGVSLATTDRTSDYLQSDEEWWQIAYKQGQYIGQPAYDPSSKTIAVNMAVPVRARGSDRIVGILRTTININSLIYPLTAGRFGQTGRTEIYLPDGNVIKLVATTADPSSNLSITMEENKNASLNNEVLNRPLPPTKNYLQLPVDGAPSLASIAGISIPGDSNQNNIITNLGWHVVVHQDQAEALTPVDTQTRNDLLMAILVTMAAAIAAVVLSQLLTNPIIHLNEIAKKVAAGDLNVSAKVESGDETGTLALTINNMISQLRGFIGSLERRVADRTHDLELAAEVGRAVSETSLDINSLLSRAVELIGERFDLYYTQIYLVDPEGRKLVLRAGTGDVGSILLSRAHHLPIASGSINGRVAAEKHSVIVADTKQSADFKPNPLLPNTRCEMAVPLIAGKRVVGVLDMQSENQGTLSESNLPAFEALAGQLAIAIQNAALFAETEQARSEVEEQVHHLTQRGWQGFLDAIERGEMLGFAYEQSNIVSLEGESLTTVSEGGYNTPISFSGTKIGEIQLEQGPDHKLTVNETELVEGAAAQLAQHIENLRLLAQAEKYRGEAEDAVRRLTREGWDTYLQEHTEENFGFEYDLNEVRPLDEGGEGHSSELIQPLAIRDEIVGELSASTGNNPQENANELISAVATQLSAHLENLRLSISNMSLLKSTEKRAQREQTLREITNALRSSTNPATIMRTAVEELGNVLGRKAIVQLITPEQAAKKESNPGEG